MHYRLTSMPVHHSTRKLYGNEQKLLQRWLEDAADFVTRNTYELNFL